MKGLKEVATGLFVAGLLVGCGDASDVEVKDKKEEPKQEQPAEEKKTESAAGARSNPVQLGQSATFDDTIYDSETSTAYTAKVEVSVQQVLRGAEAWGVIQKENQFNKEPEAGMEYTLVKLKVKVVDADTEDFAYRTADISNVEFISADGKVYEYNSDFHPVIPTPLENEIFKGAETEGYAVQYVKQGDDFKIAYKTNKMKKIYFNSK